MDCSLPDSSVCGIFQARILERVAIFSSRGSSRPGDWTHVSGISCTGRWILYHWAIWQSCVHTLDDLTSSERGKPQNKLQNYLRAKFGMQRFPFNAREGETNIAIELICRKGWELTIFKKICYDLAVGYPFYIINSFNFQNCPKSKASWCLFQGWKIWDPRKSGTRVVLKPCSFCSIVLPSWRCHWSGNVS